METKSASTRTTAAANNKSSGTTSPATLTTTFGVTASSNGNLPKNTSTSKLQNQEFKSSSGEPGGVGDVTPAAATSAKPKPASRAINANNDNSNSSQRAAALKQQNSLNEQNDSPSPNTRQHTDDRYHHDETPSLVNDFEEDYHPPHHRDTLSSLSKHPTQHQPEYDSNGSFSSTLLALACAVMALTILQISLSMVPSRKSCHLVLLKALYSAEKHFKFAFCSSSPKRPTSLRETAQC